MGQRAHGGSVLCGLSVNAQNPNPNGQDLTSEPSETQSPLKVKSNGPLAKHVPTNLITAVTQATKTAKAKTKQTQSVNERDRKQIKHGEGERTAGLLGEACRAS